MQEMQVWSLGWDDSLEKEMATHSSILAWEIPWTEEPGRLPSMGLESQTWLSDSATTHLCIVLGANREGNGNSLQYSYLENPMDGGAW